MKGSVSVVFLSRKDGQERRDELTWSIRRWHCDSATQLEIHCDLPLLGRTIELHEIGQRLLLHAAHRTHGMEEG